MNRYVTLGVLVCFAGLAQAELFKCVDAAGKVTYQDAACTGNSRVDLVIQKDGSKLTAAELAAKTKREKALALEATKARLEASERTHFEHERRSVTQDASNTANYCAEYIGRGIACGLDTTAFAARCGKRVDELTVGNAQLRAEMIKRMTILVPASLSIQRKQDYPCSAVRAALNG